MLRTAERVQLPRPRQSRIDLDQPNAHPVRPGQGPPSQPFDRGWSSLIDALTAAAARRRGLELLTGIDGSSRPVRRIVLTGIPGVR
jgi:hypothetical protein